MIRCKEPTQIQRSEKLNQVDVVKALLLTTSLEDQVQPQPVFEIASFG